MASQLTFVILNVQVWCIQFWSHPMGACYSKVAVEWDESYASCWCCRFPKSSFRYPQRCWSFSCKYYLAMLAAVSTICSKFFLSNVLYNIKKNVQVMKISFPQGSKFETLICSACSVAKALAASSYSVSSRPASFTFGAGDFCKFYPLNISVSQVWIRRLST